MKHITNYLNESKTGDLFLTVAECIKDPKNITDADIKNIIKTVKQQFGFELSSEQAGILAKDTVENFPEMINNDFAEKTSK